MATRTQLRRSRAVPTLSMALALLLNATLATTMAAPPTGPPEKPNILFFILDDVGIDQMQTFGYGGSTPPRTPNIDSIARAGVRFRNTWAMPECSPSRAMFFQGRYPFRTNVLSAILAQDLANSQVSPYEITTPQVLKQQGYTSALFGKAHLSGSALNPRNNPLGNGVMHTLGWDYFAGSLDGAPFPIDHTAGGVGAPVYGCGFVPNADVQNGADTGACYFVNKTCSTIARSFAQPTPGRTCLEQGGIFVPQQSCQSSPPSGVNFTTQNGYYVAQLVISREDGSVESIPPPDPRVRGYRTVIESDLAIDWVKKRPANSPWMATVGYSSAHTPYQQPPTALLPLASVDTGSFNCTDTGQQRILSNQMIEAMDRELGRVMVEVGLATRKLNGELDYHPETTNTMVIVIGDNGTFGSGVKAPFNPNRAKASPYQTGVWVPLIVAGPLVNAPDREVQSMVNVADLFELFGEIAGVDVHKVVPKSHILDSASMLPYLTDPGHGDIRKFNFTQTAGNIQPAGVVIPPCVVQSLNTCVQLFPQAGLCAANGGVWYGPGGAAGPQGLSSCCAVNSYRAALSPPQPPAAILPHSQLAIRNDHFKLVQLQQPNCETGQLDTEYEFYEINERRPLPALDDSTSNLLKGRYISWLVRWPRFLPPIEQANFNSLSAELRRLLDSQPPPCPGDGNLDLLVNDADITNWQYFSAHNGGNSSWYDFNFDGKTDALDLSIIQQNLGKDCRPKIH